MYTKVTYIHTKETKGERMGFCLPLIKNVRMYVSKNLFLYRCQLRYFVDFFLFSFFSWVLKTKLNYPGRKRLPWAWSRTRACQFDTYAVKTVRAFWHYCKKLSKKNPVKSPQKKPCQEGQESSVKRATFIGFVSMGHIYWIYVSRGLFMVLSRGSWTSLNACLSTWACRAPSGDCK